ncbi:MAG: hypothetical protein WC679_01160 [Bacteroidales bacterium]|jgi:hypothetical protein
MIILSTKDFCKIIGKCTDCNYDVADYRCNSDLQTVRPESINYDYWMSCTNINCKNHYGTGYLQNRIPWLIRK